MKKYLLLTSIIGITNGNIMAAEKNNNFYLYLSPKVFSGSLSLGSLEGKAKETVILRDGYNEHQLSLLDWKINHAAIIKGELSWHLLHSFTLTAKGWTTLASKGSSMDDWDWKRLN